MVCRKVVGLQWGDEGKGKYIDAMLARKLADALARYKGGGNAGHTIQANGTEHIFHNVPSGMLHRGVPNVCGDGMVLNLEDTVGEIRALQEAGYDCSNLYLSENAHVILPVQKIADGFRASSKKIGTTGRGIGPCYADKALREGLRLGMLRNPQDAIGHLGDLVERYNTLLPGEPTSAQAIVDYLMPFFESLQPKVTDTSKIIYDRIMKGEVVLAEGAQGVLLGIDSGTYPFVTSSEPATAADGLGFGESLVSETENGTKT